MSRDAVFHALGDPTRRLLLDRLSERNGQSVAELSAGLRISRQAVAKHLKVLGEARLVLSERVGRKTRNHLNPVPLHTEAAAWLRRFSDAPLSRLGPPGE